MIRKEDVTEERIRKIAEIAWISDDMSKPFETILNQTYQQICASIIAEKIVSSKEGEDFYVLCSYIKTEIKEMVPVFYKNIFEWGFDQPLSDIKYRNWSLSDIIDARNCDFYSAAIIMSAFISGGNRAGDDFPYFYNLDSANY